MGIKRWWRAFKSAITGKYVRPDQAREHPETTYAERRERFGHYPPARPPEHPPKREQER